MPGYIKTAIIFFILTAMTFCIHINSFSDEAYFGGDTWEYHSMAVNFALGNHFMTFGEIYPIEKYKFSKPQDPYFSENFHKLGQKGGIRNFFRVPGYPIFLGILYKIVGISPFYAKLANLLFLVISASLLQLIGWLYLGKPGFMAGIISSFLFVLLYQHTAGEILTEPITVFLASAIVLSSFLFRRHPTILNAISSGSILSIAIFTKGVFIFFPLFFLPVIIWRSLTPALSYGDAGKKEQGKIDPPERHGILDKNRHCSSVAEEKIYLTQRHTGTEKKKRENRVFLYLLSNIATVSKNMIVSLLVWFCCISIPLVLYSFYVSNHFGRFVFLSTQSENMLLDGNNELTLENGDWHPEWRQYPDCFYNQKNLEGGALKKVFEFYRNNPGYLVPAMLNKLKSGFDSFYFLKLAMILFSFKLMLFQLKINIVNSGLFQKLFIYIILMVTAASSIIYNIPGFEIILICTTVILFTHVLTNRNRNISKQNVLEVEAEAEVNVENINDHEKTSDNSLPSELICIFLNIILINLITFGHTRINSVFDHFFILYAFMQIYYFAISPKSVN
ncbi:MAG: hypothetical protein HQM10_23810 [Candidatus Riflebacteria bacterium]|nr:hypothetical protein [Candidatus Riflebacteria bacterium]